MTRTLRAIHHEQAAGTEAATSEQGFDARIEHVHRFVTQLNGEVTDVEAKKTEVEKMVRERAAAKAKAEAERKERELAERSMGDDDDMDDDDREQAAG